MKLNFRHLLALFMCGAVFTACSRDDNSSSVTPDTDEVEVTDCSSATGVSKVICLANALKAQLSTSQISTLQQSTYTKANAIRWSNFPQQLFTAKRVGLNFGSMTDTQISYAKALIKELAGSTVSNEGYEEIIQILNADDYLNSVDSRGGYGSSEYYLAFLGEPSTSGTFSIMFGGHHLAFQNTYNNGTLTGVTPSFRGVEPVGTFTYNNTTNQPLEQEKAAIIAVLASLSSSELSSAKISVSDLVAGPQNDSSIPSTYSGVKLSSLTSAQKTLVLDFIKTYVYDVADYSSYLTLYTNELDDTYISYSGTTAMATRGDYFRVHGPSVWIEWAMQPNVALSYPHVHSVWRDRNTDYGGN